MSDMLNAFKMAGFGPNEPFIFYGITVLTFFAVSIVHRMSGMYKRKIQQYEAMFRTQEKSLDQCRWIGFSMGIFFVLLIPVSRLQAVLPVYWMVNLLICSVLGLLASFVYPVSMAGLNIWKAEKNGKR